MRGGKGFVYVFPVELNPLKHGWQRGAWLMRISREQGGGGRVGRGTVMWTLVPEMPQLASYSPYFAVLFRVEKPSTGGAIGQ